MAGPTADVLGPLQVIREAQKQVPAVKYALAAAGIAAAAGLAVLFLGNSFVAVVIFGAMIVAMFIVYLFARLITLNSGSVRLASLVMLWAVTIFFCAFLLLTLSAYTLGVPQVYAGMLGVSGSGKSGFWIVAKSSPASREVAEQGLLASASAGLRKCGQIPIQDSSDKFPGFTGGLIVVVAGPFDARDIDDVLAHIKTCVPGAYKKWSKYSG